MFTEPHDIFRRKMLSRRHLGYQFFDPDDRILYLSCGSMDRKVVRKETTIIQHVLVDTFAWTLTKADYCDETDGYQLYMSFGKFNRRAISCSVLSITDLYRLYRDLLREHDLTVDMNKLPCMYELLKYLFAPLNFSSYRLFMKHLSTVSKEEALLGG